MWRSGQGCFGGRNSILKDQSVGRGVNPVSGAQMTAVKGMMGRKSQSGGCLANGLHRSLQTTALPLRDFFV